MTRKTQMTDGLQSFADKEPSDGFSPQTPSIVKACVVVPNRHDLGGHVYIT
jgi:hypothetical protein